jgi:hypothetical protein
MNNDTKLNVSPPTGGEITPEPVHILTIGRHPGILATVVRLVNNNPLWHCTGVITDVEALAVFTTLPFKLVLLGNGIGPESEATLCTAFRAHNPQISIVQHYGGGSGLLFAEIYQGLGG